MSLRHTISAHLRSFEKEFRTLNRVEISRSAILHNFDLFKSLAPTFESIIVLKANAYGHGLVPIAEILKERSFAYIAVDGYFEGFTIREITKQPILVMGAIDPSNFANIRCEKFTFVVHDEETVKALGNTRKKVKIHLELDTGMSRHGVRPAKLSPLLDLIKKYSNLELEGVMSHLADAGNAADTSYTEAQTHLFDEGVKTILEAGFTPRLFHMAQSAGSVKVKSAYANALRYGIGLYGINPLNETDPHYHTLEALRPALKLTSTVTKINELEPEESVGYGRTFIAKRKSRVGVIPIGYYEGLPRKLSNSGVVTVGNTVLPIVGRVCMNHTMLDLTDTTLEVGAVVTVISDNPSDPNSVTSISAAHDIYRYEVLTALTEHLRRVITP